MKRYLFLLLISFFATYLHAFNPQSMYDFDIKHWGNSHGLSSNSVRTITQDQQGYLWLGTLYGLNRFDGNEFEYFNTSNQTSLLSNNITKLLSDSNGYIWIGTKFGLNGVNPDTLLFDRYQIDSEISSMVEVAPGEIWVAAEFLYRIKAGQVSRFEKIEEPINQLELLGDSVWLTSTHWLYRYDLTNESLSRYALPLELVQIPIYDLAWSEGQLYLGSESGLFTLNDSGVISKSQLPDNTDVAVYKILQDSHGNNWISANRKLFHQYAGNEWQFITADELGDSPWFTDIYEDRDQNIWLTSYSDGVYRSTLGNINRIAPEGADPIIWSIAVSPRDSLVLASPTQIGELSVEGSYQKLLNTEQLSLGSIHEMYWPNENELWLATAQGVYSYNINTNTVSSVFAQLDKSQVRVLQPAQQGGLWVAGVMGLYHYQNGKLAPYSLNNELDTKHITVLRQQNGAMWLGTIRGLYQYKDNKLTQLGAETALASSYITDILSLDNGSLIASTLDDGIFIKNPNQAWFQLHHNNGLLQNPVVTLQYDEKNDVIWLSSLHGIFRYNRADIEKLPNLLSAKNLIADEVLSPYDRQLGTIPGRCCNGAGHDKVAFWQQRYWYPTLKGVVSVLANLDQQKQRNIKPVVKRIQANKEYNLINQQDNLLLELNERTLTIHYSALEFIKPSAVEFRYQLVGFEDIWHEVGTRREAIYTNLGAGRFTFRVQSRFANQAWQTKNITEFEIIVPKRFDETLIYRGLWLLLALFCLYGILWLLRRNAINKQHQLGQLVKQRTQELENSNLKLNELNEQMALLTYKDNLTGLRNRRFMFEQLPKDIEHFHRNRESMQNQGKGVALLLLDLDNFKRINDQYGNLAGDNCMQQVAWLLIRETRGSDYVVRFSANEFVIVLRDIQIDLVSQFCNQLNEKIARTIFSLPDGKNTQLTCSIGYALYPLPLLGGQLISWEISLQLAGISLSHVKHSGKNGVASIDFDQQVDAFEFEDSVQIESQVERLLAAGLAHFNLYRAP